MVSSDLDAIDPTFSGTEMSEARSGAGTSALLILAVCVAFAIVVSAAVSVFVVTGNAWFGAVLGPLAAWFLFGTPATGA